MRLPTRSTPSSSPRPGLAGWLALILLASAPAQPAAGQATLIPTSEPPPPSAEQPAPAEETPPEPQVPAEFRSPRAVVETFVARMRDDDKAAAAELLDLSALSAIAADSRRTDLAYKLYRLLTAVGTPPTTVVRDGAGDFANNPEAATRFTYQALPAEPDAPSPWPLSGWLLNADEDADELTVERSAGGAWRFSDETVAQIDSLYERVEQRIDEAVAIAASEDGEPTATVGAWLRSLFPRSLRETWFLLPTYQWILLLGLLPISRLVEQAVRLGLTWLGDNVVRRYDSDFAAAHETTARVWRPVGRLANAAVWTYGAYKIQLPPEVVDVLLTVLVGVAVVAAVLAAFRVLDLVAGYFLRRAKRKGRKFDDLFVPLAATSVKILAVLIGVLIALRAYSVGLPAELLGGLGIGGIAIALASQETLSNFVGSIALLLDRPFEVGDWVVTEGVEGEIEALGFRSTRFRTGPNSQVTVPNSKLAGANIDNLGRRKYRRYLNKLGLEYGTPPERIEAFCEGVRELIRRHPHTRKDFYAAYFNDFGPSSLDVLVVCFFEAPDWATELRERHRLLADIARLAESLGVAFAFPTQTVHLHRGETPQTLDPLEEAAAQEAGQRAAAQIAGELPNYQDRPGRVKFTGPTQLD